MQTLIFLPFLIQAAAISFDEYYFHIKRGLPKWERIGHPLDTLSFMACLAFVLLIPYEASMIKVYIALAVLSCLMITKDEFVHKHHCPAAEQWLHALLFVNHSAMLTAMGFLWPKVHGAADPSWVPEGSACHTFLWVQAGLVALFFLYQVIYWNFLWKESTTNSTTN